MPPDAPAMADREGAGGARLVAKGRPSLSGLVVAHNEEAALPDCLRSLAFVDEIVVVLDRCTDGSRPVAERFGARVIEGAWPIEGDRRNTGIDACRGDWVIEVDADERVSPALAAEILALLPTAATGHFGIPFNNYIGNRLVRHGWGAYNGVQQSFRLFSRGCKRWGGQLVHPKLELKGRRGVLSNKMEHFVDRDLFDLFDRLNRYTTLAAREALETGERPSFGAAFRRLFGRFYKSFIGRRGYREGIYGIALALFSALYPMLIYLKTREMQSRHGLRDRA